MKRVFISYAHSEERSRAVAELVQALRATDISTAVDTDIVNPAGPSGGWGRWAEQEIEKADYVLMFFDQSYRRRFDGQEKPGVGQGSSFEAVIINGIVYGSPATRDKFIPLLPEDEASTIIPAIFQPSQRYIIARETTKLIEALRRAPLSPGWKAARLRQLWCLAYAFLRLDQLASGGWGKTLPQWMEAIWEGEAGTITRSPEMKREGGTDFTCSAFSIYAQFLEQFVPEHLVAILSRENHVASEVVRNLRARIDRDPDMNTGVMGHRVPTKFNIRHTAMVMATLLACGNPRTFGVVARSELKLTATYLNANLIEHWRHDRSHVFAMFAALTKLASLLESSGAVNQFEGAENERKTLLENIHCVLPDMRRYLTDGDSYDPLPAGTQKRLDAHPFFVPYGRFWRMERSSFLMYVPLLLTADGSQFAHGLSGHIAFMARLFQCFDEMLRDVAEPFEAAHPERSLVRYHCGTDRVASPRDWGLTATLAAVLQTGAVRELMMLGHESYNTIRLQEIDGILQEALLSTFDRFDQRPDLFKFTQGLSFGSALGLLQKSEASPDEIARLDRAATNLLRTGVTEKSLTAFVKDCIALPAAEDGEGEGGIHSEAVRDMLMVKLQSGEHKHGNRDLLANAWSAVNHNIIQYYDGPPGRKYADHYQNPISHFIAVIGHVFGKTTFKGMTALDVACGPGQYARLLKERGFDVDLYDASVEMLKIAAASLKRKVPKPRDYYRLSEECSEAASYDLVFACAMMVHVPVEFAASIYDQFYRILKPGGVLFVNFKIGDHSLFDVHGRFFEYYSSRQQPLDMLEAAGFRIESIIEQWNYRTSNNLLREIHWANMICRKPLDPSDG